MAVLIRFPSAKAIAACKRPGLEKIISTASKKRLGRDRAEKLIAAAKSSIGTTSVSGELELQMLLEQIQLLDKHILRFEEKIRQILDQVGTNITSVPGIGPVLGAMIIGEIGSIERFSSSSKLLAFSGMEPSVYQSGNFTPSGGTMVKRGSPYLRWALGQAARCAAQFNPIFHDYLEKKLAEGKHYNVAISHVVKKLVRLIFAILKNHTSYSLLYTSFAA